MIALLHQLRQGLAPAPKSLRHPRVWPWFCLMLTCAGVAAARMMAARFAEPYLIPDDARQHLFWMARFIDPALFQEDLIADYYEAVSPKGFVTLYRVAAFLGIQPLVFNSLLASIVVILTTTMAFLVGLELWGIPSAALAGGLLILQSGDVTVNVASGTARAFVYLLLLLFLYGWLRRSCWLSWLAIALQGLIHPQTVLISAGVLGLGGIARQKGHWQIRGDRRLRELTVGGLIIAAGAIGYYGLSTSEYGPTIGVAEALQMSEFHDSGRSQFFRSDPVDFLLAGRSGLGLDIVFTPITNLLALILPLLLAFPKRFALAGAVGSSAGVLLRLVAASLTWFLLAHVLLFRLHLPSRYTTRYLMVAAALAAAVTLVILLDALLGWVGQQAEGHQTFHPTAWLLPTASAIASGIVLLALLYPFVRPGFPSMALVQGSRPELYQFFQSQPKNSLVASLMLESNFLGPFAHRSVLVSSETAIPYHKGYYTQVQQRIRELISAQYSSDPAVLASFTRRYGITHWLMHVGAFRLPAFNRNRWLHQYQPEARAAGALLSTGELPVLARVGDRCVMLATADYQVLDAACILTEIEP